jgi:hypothetical protein
MQWLCSHKFRLLVTASSGNTLLPCSGPCMARKALLLMQVSLSCRTGDCFGGRVWAEQLQHTHASTTVPQDHVSPSIAALLVFGAVVKV